MHALSTKEGHFKASKTVTAARSSSCSHVSNCLAFLLFLLTQRFHAGNANHILICHSLVPLLALSTAICSSATLTCSIVAGRYKLGFSSLPPMRNYHPCKQSEFTSEAEIKSSVRRSLWPKTWLVSWNQ